MILTTGYQDKTVLRNTYSQIYQWNRSLRLDSRMEKLAQSHGCVRTHSDHQGTWQDKEILDTYYNRASNIACTGGCRESASNWSKAKPAQIWYEYRHQTGHYQAILNNNRVGCSAEVDGKDICVFCYFAKDNSRQGIVYSSPGFPAPLTAPTSYSAPYTLFPWMNRWAGYSRRG